MREATTEIGRNVPLHSTQRRRQWQWPPPTCRAPARAAAGSSARAPAGLAHLGLSRSALRPVSLVLRTSRGSVSASPLLRCAASSSAAARPASAPRFIQHKKEAFWFYRFLSIVYDHAINPGHWTEDMRDDALEPADLHSRKLKVVDVGGGTGFTTLGIVKHVDKENVTLLDQSPHQLEKARQKEALKAVKRACSPVRA